MTDIGIIGEHLFCNHCGDTIENKFCCAERMWADINVSLDKGTLTSGEMDAHMSRLMDEGFEDQEEDENYELKQKILDQDRELANG